jgi:hypothetical protein
MNTPQINNGGPAFPCESYGLKNGKETTVPAQGMTLRDWVAGQAIGHIASYSMTDEWARSGPEWRGAAASEAYRFADAMIKAREVKP